MKVRTVRGEIINLDLVKEFSLEDDTLLIKDGERIRKYTLTEESKDALEKEIESVK